MKAPDGRGDPRDSHIHVIECGTRRLPSEYKPSAAMRHEIAFLGGELHEERRVPQPIMTARTCESYEVFAFEKHLVVTRHTWGYVERSGERRGAQGRVVRVWRQTEDKSGKRTPSNHRFAQLVQQILRRGGGGGNEILDTQSKATRAPASFDDGQPFHWRIRIRSADLSPERPVRV